MSERIATNARAIRGAEQIKIATLARRSGFPERKVQRLLSGNQKWFAEDIEAMAAALGVDWLALIATTTPEAVVA